MFYVLLFVMLIVIQWIACLCITESCMSRLKVKNLSTYESIKKIHRKRYCVIVCAEIILFTGLRALNVGADNSTYLAALTYYKELPHNRIITAKLVYPFDFEAGYFLLTKLCAYLRFSQTGFLFVIAVLTYIPLFAFINKYSLNPLISILTYFAFGFFTYSIGLFRQMIAISICLSAIPLIKEKKWFKYCLVCVVASLFHLTSLIMVPFYWLARFDVKKHKRLFLLLVVAAEAICFFFARSIIIAILRFIPSYAGYIGGKYDVQGGSYLGLIYLNLLLFLGVFLVAPRVERSEVFPVVAIAVACIIQSCAYSMGIMGRLVNFYSVYGIILFPLIAEKFAKEKMITNAGVIIALLGLAVLTMSSDAIILGYKFIWS